MILDAGGVTFGENVFVGPSCGFHTSGHTIDFRQRNKGLEYAYPIVVGDHVWIGASVQVMPGVTIGSHPLFTPEMKIYSDSSISDFFRSIKENQRQDFLDNWNEERNNRERIYISYVS